MEPKIDVDVSFKLGDKPKVKVRDLVNALMDADPDGHVYIDNGLPNLLSVRCLDHVEVIEPDRVKEAQYLKAGDVVIWKRDPLKIKKPEPKGESDK